MPYSAAWQPTQFLRFEAAYDTSMGTARIVTDAGPAYVKALGNRQGPHPLACEWVATQLADWFGLSTFDFALLAIDESIDEIPFRRGGRAKSGSAFVTRATAGRTWGGTTEELSDLVNPAAVSHLVLFDTWTLNCDRHPPDPTKRKPNYDNVFLADAPDGRCELVAMDHTHCFTCGREISAKTASIDRVKDQRLYGLFPGFVPLVKQDDCEAAISRLRRVERPLVQRIVASIPADWEVEESGRRALVDLVCHRADFVAAHGLSLVAKACWPGQLFDQSP